MCGFRINNELVEEFGIKVLIGLGIAGFSMILLIIIFYFLCKYIPE